MKLLKQTFLFVLCFSTVFLNRYVQGQDGNAGVESLFHSIGTSARILGMGSSAAAYPDDPSAFAWNPAGMVVVQKKGIGFTLVTLFEGVQYQSVGYIHPTMNSGTFGIGVSRIGVGGIQFYDNIDGLPVNRGEYSFWKGKLTLAYAARIWGGLSLGINFNALREVLGYYATNGFGLDAGIHYGFTQQGILNDLHIGVAFFNALPPRMQLKVQQDVTPNLIRAGIAKKINMRRGQDHWLFTADVSKYQYHDLRYHIGTELCWNQNIFIRAGYDNGKIVFGGGLRLLNFQVDYGYKAIGYEDYFSKSHLFSLNMLFGKSIPAQRRLLEEQRRLDVQRRFSARIAAERQKRINEGLEAGKSYLENEDYFNARLEFSRVLREDSENREAQTLLQQTTDIELALQQAREQQLLKQERDKTQQQRDNAFVNKKLKEGIRSLETGDFQNAIEKWREALTRDPENPQLKMYIGQAQETLSSEIAQMISRANQLVRQENVSEAYKVLGRAKEQSVGDEELKQRVERQVRALDRYVDFTTNYQEGVQRYSSGDYKAAAQSFKRALNIRPEDPKVKEFYRNAMARTQGTDQTMSDAGQLKFKEGIQLYRQGQYESAITVWEEALKTDSHNLRILEAIESAKRKLDTFRKKDQ